MSVSNDVVMISNEVEGKALTLSGGGFRAMLYHVGALWRLNELVSSISIAVYTDAERSYLVNWGYVSADTAIRSHVLLDAPPPTKLPFPSYSFEVAPFAPRRIAVENPGDEIQS